MNKYLILILISSLGYSQQVLKKITETSVNTIIELYTFRNGTSSGNVIAYLNFSQITNLDPIIFKNSNNSITYVSNSACCGVGLNLPNENLCNGTFQNLYWGSYSLIDFCEDTTCANQINLDVNYLWTIKDCVTDNNNEGDLLTTLFSLPKILSNGMSIPTGTWVICGSRSAIDNTNGIDISQKDVCLRFNGTTWEIQSTYPDGSAIPVINDICNSGLNIADSGSLENDITIFPNPTDNYIMINNSKNITGIIDYIFFDITGRIIKIGSSRFDEKIDIADIAIGNYIIQVKDENNQILHSKIIKK